MAQDPDPSSQRGIGINTQLRPVPEFWLTGGGVQCSAHHPAAQRLGSASLSTPTAPQPVVFCLPPPAFSVSRLFRPYFYCSTGRRLCPPKGDFPGASPVGPAALTRCSLMAEREHIRALSLGQLPGCCHLGMFLVKVAPCVFAFTSPDVCAYVQMCPHEKDPRATLLQYDFSHSVGSGPGL